MRRWIYTTICVLLIMGNTGCIFNQYSSDPNERMQELLNESENLRQMRGEWQRFWMIDQPSHLTPIRVHGGVGP